MQPETDITRLHFSIRPLIPFEGTAREGDQAPVAEWSFRGKTSRIWHRPFWLWPADQPEAGHSNGHGSAARIHYQADPGQGRAGQLPQSNGAPKPPSPQTPHQISIQISAPGHPRLVSLEGIGPAPENDPELGAPLPCEFFIYDGALNLGGHHMRLASRLIACLRPVSPHLPPLEGELSLRLTLVHPEAGLVFDHLGSFRQATPQYALGG